MNESLDRLIAYVSPRSRGGTKLFSGGANIRAETIDQFTSTREDRTRAVGKLVDKGFEVERISEVSIRVTGPAKLFKKRFGLNFEKRSDHGAAMYAPTEATMANCLDLGSEVFDGMVFPQPIELHGKKKAVGGGTGPSASHKKSSTKKKTPASSSVSAKPPHLNYHHMEVPKDIVRALNAGPVHDAGNKGDGIKAAMIDSGFHWSHPWFKGKGFDLEVALPQGSDADDNGHGTGESANLLSIAPKVKLFGLSMSDAIQAFVVCRQRLGVQIISNSWGSAIDTEGPLGTWDPYWSLVLAEISLCVASGIVVLFSGGNGGMSATASTPDVISVGGVYMDETGALKASDYASSFDSFRFQNHPQKHEVHVPEVCGLCGMKPAATYIALPIPPGCKIDKERGGGSFPAKDETGKNDGWGVFSGTSAACPMVAGVVALILKAHPGIGLSEVRRRLYQATDVTLGSSSHGQAAGAGYDPATGYGLVDAERAVG